MLQQHPQLCYYPYQDVRSIVPNVQVVLAVIIIHDIHHQMVICARPTRQQKQLSWSQVSIWQWPMQCIIAWRPLCGFQDRQQKQLKPRPLPMQFSQMLSYLNTLLLQPGEALTQRQVQSNFRTN
jgi:hypothetical protein